MHDQNGFARRLDLALRARRVGKMHALAVALDIDESALSRWRRGKPISVGNLMRLASHLHVSMDWLLTGAGAMERAEASAEAAWRAELIADITSLDPALRERLANLVRHLADARRTGGFDPVHWAAPSRPDASGRPSRGP